MFKLLTIDQKWLLKFTAIALIVAVSLASITSFFLLPVPIFAFHSIFDENRPNELPSRAAHLDYSLQNLEKLLIYFIKNDYWFLSTQEFYDYFVSQSQPTPKHKFVMLTFDDGYKNIDAYLLPLLQKLQKNAKHPLKIVLFINPGKMNSAAAQKQTQYLKCEDLKRGTALGFYDVQSHSYNHIDLTRISSQELENELRKSQQSLQSCISKLPLHIAYPYNKVNKNVEKLTPTYYQSGYLFSSRLRHFLILTKPFYIPRIGVSKKDTPETLIQLSQRYSKLN